MKAVVLEAYGEPDVLKIKDIPSPQPSAGEVLVKNFAAGINRLDIMQRQGKFSRWTSLVKSAIAHKHYRF